MNHDAPRTATPRAGDPRLSRTLLVGVATLAVLTGCTTAVPSSPAPTAASAPGPASDSPTASAAPTSPSSSASKPATTAPPSVATREQATLTINPVDFNGSSVAVAAFAHPIEGRRVDLERKTAQGWKVAASGTQDHKGVVEFAIPYVKAASYRAVAQATSHDGTEVPALATVTASREAQWRIDFADEFNGTTLGGKWKPRQTGEYFGSRLCSAPYPSMSSVRNGSWQGVVKESGGARTRQVEASAAQARGVPTSQACPDGVWDLAMISTQGIYQFKYGITAVRAKFPQQSGVHGSAWLQSYDPDGAEIDFIETFGPDYGIQHKVHYKKNGKAAQVGGYVRKLPAVKSPQWWNSYHVFSVEWTPDLYVFRVDGVETFRTRKGVSRGDEFLVLSLLASDWALERINRGAMPAKMSVDWIRVWQEKG